MLILSSNHNRCLLLFLIMILFISKLSVAQSTKIGSVEYLAFNNGFKGIRLGADLGTIKCSKLSYLDNDDKFDADSCLKFAISDSSFLKVNNDLTLDMIGVRTYKNRIVNIYLFFQKSDSYKILSNFLATYGIFTSKPFEYKNIYDWDCSDVSLSLMYQADVDDGVAIFSCNPLIENIAKEKEMAAIREKAKLMKEINEPLSSRVISPSENTEVTINQLKN